jgi:hypothetical protein
MNDMTPNPRHKQAPITIRSDEAVRLLKELTRDGRSQAQVIEQALLKEVAAKPSLSREEFIAEIAAIVRPNHGRPGKAYKELREEMYDEFGLPR